MIDLSNSMTRLLAFCFVASFFLFGCSNQEAHEEHEELHEVGFLFDAVEDTPVLPRLVPKPESMETMPGGPFVLVEGLSIGHSGEGAEAVAQYLAERLQPSTGFAMSVGSGSGSAINLELNPELHGELGDEGYHLVTSHLEVRIAAAKPAGLFYGCQTLCQLFPAAIDSPTTIPGVEWTAPSVKIVDQPRFEWRGLMLDTCRHFFSKDDVKRYIELLSRHKMNSFHWHLTEDQGWRIEIPEFPKLATISSKRAQTPIPANRKKGDGKPYGPFIFSTEDVKEVVAFAQSRFVNVVPEIEMPGHSLAALAAYPELACTDGPFEVGTRWGVYADVYCAGNEKSFEFLEKVIDHVVTLFPGPFFHVGGDECPKSEWKKCEKCQARIREHGLKDEHELQSYFIARMEKYLNAKGKRLIGWDEILEGGLAPNATVMSWRGIKGGIAAAKAGHDVVMSPGTHCYLDHYQSKDTKNEPPAIGGFTSLEKIYSYEPIPDSLTPEEAKHILGAQGNLWTEYIPTRDQADYMIYPRACALAERVWSPKGCRDWVDFQARMGSHLVRLRHLGVQFRPVN